MKKSKVLALLLLSSLVFSNTDVALAVTTVEENKEEILEKTIIPEEMESNTEILIPSKIQEAEDNQTGSSKSNIVSEQVPTAEANTSAVVTNDATPQSSASLEKEEPSINNDSDGGSSEVDSPRKTADSISTTVNNQKAIQASLGNAYYQEFTNSFQNNKVSYTSTIQPSLSLELPNLDFTSLVVNGDTYVEHWSGEDAYTHDLLSKRFGISAEQLDGYLRSTGINYDSNRINGKKLLEWEKASGLDVRAIIAIAIAESSLGTQGVAKDNKANAFGFGAFDDNPTNAMRYDDALAIKELTKITIIQNQNNSFKRQDEKAYKLAKGTLDISKDGGVYFTDTSGTGKRRAKIMEDIDKWIDKNGGTPKAPTNLNRFISTGAIVERIPLGFELQTAIRQENYAAITYPWGQCTWYVFNRAKELGYSFDSFMGNGGDWQYKAGYEKSHIPQIGSAVSFSPGQAGADRVYGHVAIVEDIKEDGSVLISESNVTGLGKISFRTFSKQEARSLTYIIGQQ